MCSFQDLRRTLAKNVLQRPTSFDNEGLASVNIRIDTFSESLKLTEFDRPLSEMFIKVRHWRTLRLF